MIKISYLDHLTLGIRKVAFRLSHATSTICTHGVSFALYCDVLTPPFSGGTRGAQCTYFSFETAFAMPRISFSKAKRTNGFLWLTSRQDFRKRMWMSRGTIRILSISPSQKRGIMCLASQWMVFFFARPKNPPPSHTLLFVFFLLGPTISPYSIILHSIVGNTTSFRIKYPN